MKEINCRTIIELSVTIIELSVMDRIRVLFGRKIISRITLDTFLVDETTLVKIDKSHSIVIDKSHSIVDVEKTTSTAEVERFFKSPRYLDKGKEKGLRV